MRFSTKQDIESSLDFAFKYLTDFESWETAAMRRGSEVSRTDKLRQPGPGMAWAVRFLYRGKPRDLDIKLVRIETPVNLQFNGMSKAIEGDAKMELMELGAKRTRLHVVMEIAPRSLTARLFLQSLRLARARVDRKFEQRVAQLARDIESRFRATRVT